tara:strand:+ start:609 stop:836 length:228 start_codon:yes stop_codon:yes gene_type:complete
LKSEKPTKGANNINSGSISRFPHGCHFKRIEKNKNPAAIDPTYAITEASKNRRVIMRKIIKIIIKKCRVLDAVLS